MFSGCGGSGRIFNEAMVGAGAREEFFPIWWVWGGGSGRILPAEIMGAGVREEFFPVGARGFGKNSSREEFFREEHFLRKYYIGNMYVNIT